MKSVFTPSVIKKIGAVLGVPGKFTANNHRFELNTAPERSLVVELYPDIPIGERTGNLVSIYTSNAHFQLHFCSGCVVSAMLGEVTFIAEHNGKVSGIIVEREGGCSFYANVDRQLLSGDFTKLGPEVMLSGIALSLTETVLEDIPAAPKRASDGRKSASKKQTASNSRTQPAGKKQTASTARTQPAGKRTAKARR